MPARSFVELRVDDVQQADNPIVTERSNHPLPDLGVRELFKEVGFDVLAVLHPVEEPLQPATLDLKLGPVVPRGPISPKQRSLL